MFSKILIFLLLGISMGKVFSNTLDIVTIETPQYKKVLTSPAQNVQFPLSAKDKALIEGMKAKLFDLGGVGLAAPQVNQSKQIIAVFIPESASLLREKVKTYPMHILINPSYQSVNEQQRSVDFEGCYSVSSKMGKLPRYEQIKLSYADEEGRRHESVKSGFYARVLQHEIDHLNGVLITDRLTENCVQGSIEEMMELRRQELPDDKKALFDELMKKKLKR